MKEHITMKQPMYVTTLNGSLVLRQERHRAQLDAGHEHPHDVCAFASSVRQMHEMVDHLWPGQIDYSAVAALDKPAAQSPADLVGA